MAGVPWGWAGDTAWQGPRTPPPPHGVVGPWSLVVLGNVDLGAVG